MKDEVQRVDGEVKQKQSEMRRIRQEMRRRNAVDPVLKAFRDEKQSREMVRCRVGPIV